MQARAAAVDELTASGALEDYTAQGDDLDRQLAQVSESSQVDDELAKLKSELGQGSSADQLATPEGGSP
jgi:phage shock protein A